MKKYIKPEIRIVEMEEIVMVVFSDTYTKDNTGGNPTGPGMGEPGDGGDAGSKGGLWNDDFEFQID